MAIKIALPVVFFIVMIGIGIYCRKHATSVNSFVLGGRSVGPWLTAFAYGTSYFSAVIFIGYAGQFGWNFGLASTWIGLGNAFIGSLLAWMVLGRRTRIMTQHIDSRTMPDFFAKRFDSKGLKIGASVIIFLFMIPYTASLYNGLSSLFNMAYGIPYWVVILVMAALTAVDVIFGGYMATAVNDFIQGLFMLLGIAVVVGAVLADNGGLTQAVIRLSEVESEYGVTQGIQGGFVSFFGTQPLYLLIVIFLTSLGTWGLPQMVGKFYSIRNEGAIKKGTVISTLFALIIAGGCYFLGGFGRLYGSEIAYTAAGQPLYDSIVPAMLSRLSDGVIAVVLVLVLSASMSTLSSLVLTSASTLTLDVITPACKKGLDEKKQITLVRFFILFFVLVSALLAILKDTFNFSMIAQMMGVSWGAMAGAFLAPFLYGLYWKKVTKVSVAVCFLFGTGVMAVQLLISLGVVGMPRGILGFIFTNSLYSGVFAMLSGFVLVPLVSLLTRRMERGRIEEIFACYDGQVTVPVTEDLGN